VEIQVLHIDDCPNWLEAGARVRSVLDDFGRTDVKLSFGLIGDRATASDTAFAGSPTIVINGVDLFPSEGQTSDLACRIYVTPHGLAGLPTTDQIHDVLAAAL
jgi:hypothetical protein